MSEPRHRADPTWRSRAAAARVVLARDLPARLRSLLVIEHQERAAIDARYRR